MTTKNQQILLNRLKAFAWSLGMMILAGFVSFLLDNLNLLDLNPQATILLGLVLAQISKYLNSSVTVVK